MRWFVDVSRVGEDTTFEKYCLEAKQWQAALQEARKRRGDIGPLSKFSIELLDNGYRAVDPAQKIRYAVRKAPSDAPLSDPSVDKAAARGSFPKAPSEPVIAEQADATDPMAAPPPSKSDPTASGPKTDPMGSLPPESSPPNTARMNQVPEKKASRPVLVVPGDDVPPAKPSPTLPVSTTERIVTKPAPAPSSRPPTTPAPAAQRAPVPKTSQPPRPSEPPPPSKPPSIRPSFPQAALTFRTQESVEVAQAPEYLVVKKREEEPTEKVPICYRELAYAVKPGTDKKAIEVLLWLRFREVSESIKSYTGRKFVQLAVFDHVFATKPARPPVATLAWKDWRGEPVVQISSAPRPASIPPARVPAHRLDPKARRPRPYPSHQRPPRRSRRRAHRPIPRRALPRRALQLQALRWRRRQQRALPRRALPRRAPPQRAPPQRASPRRVLRPTRPRAHRWPAIRALPFPRRAHRTRRFRRRPRAELRRPRRAKSASRSRLMSSRRARHHLRRRRRRKKSSGAPRTT